MSAASTGLRVARRVRGEALAGLASGVLSPADLLELAASEDGRALRRILVRTVLRELGCTERRCGQLVELLRRLAKVDDDCSSRSLTLGWLLDRRTSGQRVTAFADVLVSGCLSGAPRSAPSTGWPYAAQAQRQDPTRS
jgi:hypothetical protein